MNLKKPRAVIVDLDGTMVDTVGDFVVALQRMLADLPTPFCDYQVTPAVVEQMVGKGTEHLLKSLLGHVDKSRYAMNSEALYAQALQSYMAHYQAINGQFSRVYDGVEQGLQNLHRTGLRMACVTNKPTVLAQGLLQAKGLSAFFELVLGGDAVTRKKPDPQALLMACERLGVAPAQTLMIGDSSNDAQAGRAAGCPVLLVTYGYNHGQPVRDVVADGFTDSLADIAWED